MKKRLCYIDCLKGFAILLVVIGHVFDGYINAGMYSEHSIFMCSVYNLIYSFHMPLFFIISGYVFRVAYFKDDHTTKPSLKSQIYNVTAIYIIFSILFGLFKIVCGRFTNNSIAFTDLLLIWMKPITPYWYLYVLLFFYIIFSSKAILKLPMYIPLIVCVILSCCGGLIPESSGNYFSVQHFCLSIAFFYIGELLCADKYKWLSNSFFAFISFAISVVIMVIFKDGLTEFHGKHAYNKMPVCSFFIAFGISLLLFWIFKKLFSNEKHIHVKFFSFLGKYSLEIYVIHCVFTAGNRVVLTKLHINNFAINVICNIVISTALPILISIILKKINLHQIVFKPVTFIKEKTERKINNE